MQARDKFTKGQRVRFSAAGLASFVRGPRGGHTGIVVGFALYRPRVVRVQREGATQGMTWHMDYWDVCESGD